LGAPPLVVLYDAAAMKTTGRALAVALALVLAGCTGSGDNGGKSPGGGGNPGNGSGEPSVTISIPASSSVYRYENEGLVATIDFGAHTLEIDISTGRELPKPGFYVLDARDGHRVDGTVDGAANVPEGQTMTFDVSLPGVEAKSVGLVVLLIGKDNYGAFVQQ
jgi:hypothetical protein